MTDITGRVDTLEDQVTNLTQDMLQRPDIVTFNSYRQSHESEIDTLSNNYLILKNQLRSLQGLYSSQFTSYSALNTLLTGHTGDGTVHNPTRFSISPMQTGIYTGHSFETVRVDPSDPGSVFIYFPLDATSGDLFRVKSRTTSDNGFSMVSNGYLIEKPNDSFNMTGIFALSGAGISFTWEFDGSGWYTI